MNEDTLVKDKQLRSIDYDADTGFSSVQQTYKDAHTMNPSITQEYTKQWFDKQRGQQQKACR
eukprot:10818107-Heterocapsa_arctica.AAC.1